MFRLCINHCTVCFVTLSIPQCLPQHNTIHSHMLHLLRTRTLKLKGVEFYKKNKKKLSAIIIIQHIYKSFTRAVQKSFHSVLYRIHNYLLILIIFIIYFIIINFVITLFFMERTSLILT